MIIAIFSVPTIAVLREPTGIIQGRPPSVSGHLQVLLPDGQVAKTPGTNILEPKNMLGQLTISSSTKDLVVRDVDGDSNLTASVDTSSAVLAWLDGDKELTPEQLTAPVGDSLAGQILTLNVSAPVIASSSSGKPNIAEPLTLTSSYTFKVPDAEFTGVSVNGHIFSVEAGFPSVGFSKATFTLDMTGKPDNYIWSSNQPDSVVTINSNGLVTLESQPSSGEVTILATPKNGSGPLAYSFNIKSWFSPPGINVRNDSVVNYCESKKLVLPKGAQLSSGKEIRQVGTLFGEWGNMVNYNGGFTSNYYWTADIGASESRLFGDLTTGLFNKNSRTSELAVTHNATCMYSL